jgi:flagellar hook protein FlgE
MMRGMFAAISGLRVHQAMLDVTANNIANVNTVGFKAERVSFKDSLSQTLRGGGAPTTTSGGTSAQQVGLGVQLGTIDNVMNSGAIQSTGNPYDMAVQGDGWFQVASDPTAGAGSFFYTRSGNFSRDANGDLVTADGFYLVGMNGTTASKINVPATASSVSVDAAGKVTVVDGAVTTTYTVQLAKFPNEAGLERVSGNRYKAGNNSGAPAAGDPGSPGYGAISPGTVEMSNVELAQEFTNMISDQRGFQAASRVISTSDDMLQELVNLKR